MFPRNAGILVRASGAIVAIFLSSIWLQGAEAPSGGHTITFDHYSLIIDGQRTFIYSDEFHPFRLPSPDLWRDVFQKGGAFDPWGGPGYPKCYILTGPDFENVFYKSLIGQGATMISFYMTYGGTSWGWLPYPGVYSSYDYGSAIDEARQLTGKYAEQKLIGSFTQSVAPLTKNSPTSPNPPTNRALSLIGRFNPDNEAGLYLLIHQDSTSATVEKTRISVEQKPHAQNRCNW